MRSPLIKNLWAIYWKFYILISIERIYFHQSLDNKKVMVWKILSLRINSLMINLLFNLMTKIKSNLS